MVADDVVMSRFIHAILAEGNPSIVLWLQQLNLLSSDMQCSICNDAMSLQKRQKWGHKVGDPQPDDIVVLIDDSSPRSTWKLARVLKPIPSKDGLTRKVTLRLSGGQLLDRPIHKLIMLLPSTPQTQWFYKRKLASFLRGV